ncbi:MAG: hypothetical protein ACRDE7_13795 [Sphingobacterium sp.]
MKYLFKFLCPIMTLVILQSCEKERNPVLPDIPGPDPIVYNECPKDGDIYKLGFDTLIFNAKGEFFAIGTTVGRVQLDYKTIAMPLGVCTKTADLYGLPEYSPLFAKIKTEEGVIRDVKWDRFGMIQDMILPEDINRILKFPNDKKIAFELSLLNFNQDVIQTSPIIIIYKEKFPDVKF